MSSALLILPGDGIGPEVCAAARTVIDCLALDYGLDLEIAERDIGGAAVDRHGVPLPPRTRAAAARAAAIVLGAVGGTAWTDLPRDQGPEAGLLALRRALRVYANLRPVTVHDALVDRSSLKPDRVRGVDLVIVRELIGGVYFGKPKKTVAAGDGHRAVDTQVYHTRDIERVAHAAFALARQRHGCVTSVDKANVMETGRLWRQTVTALGRRDYPDVSLRHMLADTAAMQLVSAPGQFDVILTDNLFGDVLSDAAAMLAGSIGLLPSASIGDPGRPGLYEPIHGSAPDLAGQDLANPIAAILSLAMALRLSLRRPDLADRIDRAVADALGDGALTRDLGGALGTGAMTDAVVTRLAAQRLRWG